MRGGLARGGGRVPRPALLLCTFLLIVSGWAVVGSASVAMGVPSVGSPTAGDERESGDGLPFMSVAEMWALAERNHPRIVEAEQRLVSAGEDVEQSEAAYSPTLTVSASGLSLHVDRDGALETGKPGASLSGGLKLPSGLSLSASAQAGGGRDELRGNVSFSYPLFRTASLDGDALAAREADVALHVAQRELEQLRDEVRADVLSALHGEQVAARRLALVEEALGEAEVASKLIQNRVDLGVVPETELIGARVDLLRAQQEQLSTLRGWETRRRELAELLGLGKAVFEYAFEDVLRWTALPEPSSPAQAVERALERSIVFSERVAAQERARLQLEAEKERQRPDTQLSGGFRSSTGDTGDERRAGWNVALEVSYPLADGGQRRRTLRSREEAYARAQQAREEAELEIRDQVEEAFFQLEDALRDVEIAELELLKARLELESVRKQAELPVPSASEETVLQSERAYVRAELGWYESVQRYQARWIGWERLQGNVDWIALIGASGGASQ